MSLRPLTPLNRWNPGVTNVYDWVEIRDCPCSWINPFPSCLDETQDFFFELSELVEFDIKVERWTLHEVVFSA